MSPMPRKSEAEHDLQGTKPHYPTGARESHLESGRPRPPKWLTRTARKKFVELAKELLNRRMATTGDTNLLALAATLWERWRIASDHVIADGAVITVQYFAKDGTPYTRDRKNPHLEVCQVTERQFLSVLQQLGLTIATRDKAKVTKGLAESAAEKSIGELYMESIADRSRVVPIRPEDMAAEDESPVEESDER